MKTRMLFISRHVPTDIQKCMADDAGYTLVYGGDMNAFSCSLRTELNDALQYHDCDAICCVHPLIAMEALGISANRQDIPYLRKSIDVGIFENENRGGEFVPSSLLVQSMHSSQEERQGCSYLNLEAHVYRKD